MELHVKHHFVPQTYLRRWENCKREVFVYKTLVSHENAPVWKPYTTASIGYLRHLYTQIINGKETDDVENWFSKEFESPASEPINKAISDQKLTKDQWQILIRFLASQDVRTPYRMRQHLEHGIEFMPKVLNETLDDIKESLEAGELDWIKDAITKDCEKKSSLPIKVITDSEPGSDLVTIRVETYIGRSSWIHSIKHNLEHTLKVLLTHRWSIVKPAKGYYWFTSDNPVVKLDFTNKNLMGGWGKEKDIIFFPIGPEHAMFVQIGEKSLPKGTRLSVSETLEFRRLVAENAHRMIFSNFKDINIPNLKNRMVNNELMKIEREELQNWHSKNSELELEYSNSDSAVKKNF